MSYPTLTHASRHLRWTELACPDGTPYPEAWRGVQARGAILGWVHETIRRECGDRPLVVSSGYRTVAYNRAVGGARRSQHLVGRAMDLLPPRGMSARRLGEIVRALAEVMPEIGGIGYYNTHVHVDIRPREGRRLAVWNQRTR